MKKILIVSIIINFLLILYVVRIQQDRNDLRIELQAADDFIEELGRHNCAVHYRHLSENDKRRD